MRIHAVIERALADPEFAAGLAKKARNASAELSTRGDGVSPTAGEAWDELLAEFADGPEELGRLTSAMHSPLAAHTWTTMTTTTTITTTTTLACTTTTTTTTGPQLRLRTRSNVAQKLSQWSLMS